MLTKHNILELNAFVVKQIRILQATRRMLKEAGLDLPILSGLSMQGRKLGEVLQDEVRARAAAEVPTLPGVDDDKE